MKVVLVCFVSSFVPSVVLAQSPAASPTATPAPAATPVVTPAPAPVAESRTPLTWSAKPTGMIAIVGGFNDRGVNGIDLPTQATGTDVKSVGATARGTRVGLQVNTIAGTPLLDEMKIGGTIEADFFGGLPGQGMGDISPILRLRLAFVRAEWGRFSLTGGQNWSVFAPRNPTSVARTFLPGFHSSGNLWNRAPMIAAGAALGPATLTVAAVAPVDPVAPGGTAFSQANIAGAGELSAGPAGEARLGAAKKLFDGKLALEGGVSGRVGTERIAIDGDAIPANGVALDARIGWGSLVWVQGEAFQGENLDAYFGLDGIQATTVAGPPATTVLEPWTIPTAGGWVQLGGGWRSLELSVAYGEQTLDDERMAEANLIRQNQTWTTQLIWRASPSLAVGLAYDYIETNRRPNGTASFDDAIARHYDVALQLAF